MTVGFFKFFICTKLTFDNPLRNFRILINLFHDVLVVSFGRAVCFDKSFDDLKNFVATLIKLQIELFVMQSVIRNFFPSSLKYYSNSQPKMDYSPCVGSAQFQTAY